MQHKTVKPNQNIGKTAKRLFAYVTKGYKLAFGLVVLCILISAASSVAGSLFLQTLIDDYITPLLGSSNPVFSGLLHAIYIMGAIYLVGVLSVLVYSRLMAVLSQKILKNLRDEMFSHMQTLPIRYFDTNQTGDLMSRYTNDTDTLRQMLSQSLPQLLSSLVTIVMVFCSMIVLSPLLTVIVVAMILVMFKVTGTIGGKSSHHFQKQQTDLGMVNGYIEEMMAGQKVVKVFCHEEAAKSGFDALNEALCESAESANKYANILMPIMGNLGYLQYILLAIAGGALAISGIGGLTLGSIASFLQLSRSMSNPLSQIAQQLNAVVMALAGAKRIFNLMDEASETDEGHLTLDDMPLKGDIRFMDVDFGYTAEKPVLHDITLYAKPGQKVALVGATGAGKTTITNLLNRFYDINKGEILYDGISIDKIKKPDLRKSLGIVLQDTHLFTGTVMENIRYGKPEASDEEVIEAAKLANADKFITRLPDGYQTIIEGDSAEFSQGQKQLLSIARAAVADPPVMILDEATSSIDTRTEKIVQQGMDALMKGRTVFVIAHRLSTIQNADVILVMDDGRIVERGDHDELLAKHGLYYRLCNGAGEVA